MALFATKQPSQQVEAMPGPGAQATRPRMVLVIEALDNSYEWANRAGKILASMVLDVEQHADKIGHFRDSLIKTMEQTGGDIGMAVEQQIRDFVGNGQHRVEDNAGAHRESA
jgi:hypothetical protein